MEPGKAQDGGLPGTVRLSGDLDFRTSSAVKATLLQAAVTHPKDVIVDMDGVGFVDSSGLSALFEVAKLARRTEGRIRLIRVRRDVRRLLSVCGFIQFFDIDPAADEAFPPPAERPEGEHAGCLRPGSLALPGVPASVPVIRRCIEEVARAMGFREPALRDLLIAVSEAATNAMKHGSPRGEESLILLRYTPDGERLIVEVSDEGPGFDPLAVPVPVAEQMREGGMGVFFIRTLMDEVSFLRDDRGSTVLMIKYL